MEHRCARLVLLGEVENDCSAVKIVAIFAHHKSLAGTFLYCLKVITLQVQAGVKTYKT